MFKINPSVYSGMTAVPSEIITKHLKLSSAAQLRVILAVFANPADLGDAEKLGKVAGIPEGDVTDCLRYWTQRGVLTDDSAEEVKENAVQEEKPAEKDKAEEKKAEDIKLPVKNPEEELRPELPSRKQIAARLMESAELRSLFTEVQQMLGRTIGSNDQAVMVLLHDYYGLKPEIILMICEYARLHSKANNMSYIKATGISWSKREIDTIEAANAELKRLEKSGEYWSEVLSVTENSFSSAPTELQRETADKWISQWHLSKEVIALAYEEMKNNGAKPNIKYMDKVLASWYSAGDTTPEKIEKRRKDFEDGKLNSGEMQKRPSGKKPSDSNKGASYDIGKAISDAEKGEIVFRKRKK